MYIFLMSLFKLKKIYSHTSIENKEKKKLFNYLQTITERTIACESMWKPKYARLQIVESKTELNRNYDGAYWMKTQQG